MVLADDQPVHFAAGKSVFVDSIESKEVAAEPARLRAKP
jgi:hypothetical protein